MMVKKKTSAKKSESRTKEASARRSPGKSGQDTGGAENEFPGVHVISEQDIENHFGSTEIERGGESSQTAEANRTKADVYLQLDASVWREAKAEAARLGLALSEYVELALDRFKRDPAK